MNVARLFPLPIVSRKCKFLGVKNRPLMRLYQSVRPSRTQSARVARVRISNNKSKPNAFFGEVNRVCCVSVCVCLVCVFLCVCAQRIYKKK